MSYHKHGSVADERLLHILSYSPVPTGIYSGPDVIIDAANDAMLQLWGKDASVIGKRMQDALPELVGQPFIGILQEVIATGVDYVAKDTPVNLVVDGTLQTFYFDFIYKAVPLPDGSYAVLNTANEVTERLQSHREIEALNGHLSELNQRLQNSNDEVVRQREVLYDYMMQAPAGISIFGGPNLVYELVNERYQMILPGRDLLGKPLFEALPELVGQPVQQLLMNVWETGETLSVQELHVPIASTEGGTLEDRYFTFTYQARLDAEGTITGMYGFVYEVTEQVLARRKVEESERHFRQMADLVPAKISNALPTGEVTFLNKQWLDFSGLNLDQLRDFGYHKMMHPDELEGFQKGLAEAAATGRPFISEIRMKNTSGEYIWHLNIASPVLDENGQIKMWVGSTTDIQSLKEEEQRKSDFLNMLSHEIKTPITTIKGYVQLLKEAVAAETSIDPMIAVSAGKLDKLIRKITMMISDMLEFERLESGGTGIKKDRFSLTELLMATVDDHRIINPGYQFDLEVKCECNIEADEDKIGQVLSNLLGNAVKYSPENHLIHIKVYEDDSRNACISVQDHGIGIDAGQHEKIFERFYRVQGKLEKQFNGFGIGLFITKTIVESHGGWVSVESEKGKGSTFTVHLPMPGKPVA